MEPKEIVLPRLPVEVCNYIIELSLSVETYWNVSLVNVSCCIFSKKHVIEIFQANEQLINFRLTKNESIVIGPITMMKITNDNLNIDDSSDEDNSSGGNNCMSEITMDFPNGKLVWEGYNTEHLYLIEFYYQSVETNCEFIRRMVYVLKFIFGFECLEYTSEYYYCECDKCIELNTNHNCECYSTPQIFFLKPINSNGCNNEYLVTYKANYTVSSEDCKNTHGIADGIVIFDSTTCQWSGIKQGDGKIIPNDFGGKRFCGNYQTIMNIKLAEHNDSLISLSMKIGKTIY